MRAGTVCRASPGQLRQVDTTNFLAEADQMIGQITNLSQQLDQAYRELGPESFRDPDGKLMTMEAAPHEAQEPGARSTGHDPRSAESQRVCRPTQ